jgi:drug/metabolite transporter (DMT)-like permease
MPGTEQRTRTGRPRTARRHRRDPREDRRWLAGFVVLSFVWGTSFALIKIAVEGGVTPLWVALWRCTFGAAALLVFCLARRSRLPREFGTWGHALVVAVLLNSAPFALLAFGEQSVGSVLAGVVNATTPLLTLLFGLLLVPRERLTTPRSAGLLLGFAGILTVLGVWNGVGGGGRFVGSLACLGATACYGAGFAYTRRFFSGRPGSAEALSAVQITCATVELLAVSAVLRSGPTWPGWPAAAALLVLGTLGTGFAYVLNLRVIQIAGPTVASTVTYVVPLWSTGIGSLLLAEPLAWNTGLGALMVIAGILVTRMPASRPMRGRRAALTPGPAQPGRSTSGAEPVLPA